MAQQPESDRITDHTDRAIARLPGFEQGGTQWGRLVRALLGGWQAIEDVAEDLITKQAISTGEGVQLNNIGEILQLDRLGGQTDGNYKLALYGRAGEMGGSGTLDQILEVLGLLIVTTDSIMTLEHYPATIEFWVPTADPPTTQQEAIIIASITATKAAGVGLIISIIDTNIDGEAFIWGDSADADVNGDLPADADHGFGDEVDASDIDLDGTWRAFKNGFPISNVSSNVALASMSLTNVAYVDSENDILRMYRFDGLKFSIVGNEFDLSGMGNPAITSLSATDLAFFDSINRELQIYRFDGLDWSLIGTGFSIPEGGFPSITTLNSTDIAYLNGSSDQLRTYRFGGTTWSLVGSGLSVTANVPALAGLDGTDIAFIDDVNENLTTYRFNGSIWATVGNALNIAGIGQVALAGMDASNVAFIDTNNDELGTYSFDGSDWTLRGTSVIVAGVALSIALSSPQAGEVFMVDSGLKLLQDFRSLIPNASGDITPGLGRGGNFARLITS